MYNKYLYDAKNETYSTCLFSQFVSVLKHQIFLQNYRPYAYDVKISLRPSLGGHSITRKLCSCPQQITSAYKAMALSPNMAARWCRWHKVYCKLWGWFWRIWRYPYLFNGVLNLLQLGIVMKFMLQWILVIKNTDITKSRYNSNFLKFKISLYVIVFATRI